MVIVSKGYGQKQVYAGGCDVIHCITGLLVTTPYQLTDKLYSVAKAF